MGYDTFIWLFDTVAIILLIALVLMLCIATRFKGESTYAALVIFTVTIPDYIYNVCYQLEWNDVALLVAPLAYSANLTLMPFMLFLAHRGFNPDYRFRYSALLHFLPALAFAALVAIQIRMMPLDELRDFTVERAIDFHSLLATVNFLTLSAQLVVYSYLIFSYLRKVKRYVFSNFSKAELAGKIWIPRFITFVGILVVLSMACSFFDPFESFRLFYVVNVLAMGYLLYQELDHALAYRRWAKHGEPMPVLDASSVVTEEEVKAFDKEIHHPDAVSEDEGTLQLKQYARQAVEYLERTEAYTNPNLTLPMVSKATGITVKNLSKSINAVLGKNFFDLVNGLRIKKSQALLKQKKQLGLTLETIAEQCGFNSQYTFCRAFKKSLGVSTSEWLKLAK